MKTRHFVVVGIIVTASLAGGFAGKAQAGTACNVSAGLICGRVENVPGSAGSISVYNQWAGGSTPTGSPQSLSPGTKSRDIGIRDADGFCVPAGRTASVGLQNGTAYPSTIHNFSGCMKINDNQVASVRVL